MGVWIGLTMGLGSMTPQIGRWTTQDPMAELTNSITPYHYCLNNPISNADPTGMYTYNWNTGNYENNSGNIVSFVEVQANNFQEPPDKPSVKTNIPQSFNDILKGIANYFGWGLDPKLPKNQDKIEQGQRNLDKATIVIETTNGILTLVIPGGSVAEVMGKLQNGQGMAALAAVPFVILDFVPGEGALGKGLCRVLEVKSLSKLISTEKGAQ